MNRTQIIRLLAGALVLTGTLLSIYANQNWIWLAVFVGANLFQSALTKWCLLEKILIKAGVKGEC